MLYTVNKAAIQVDQNVAKTLLYVKAAANVPIKIHGYSLSFNGKTAGEAKILCEVMTGTAAGDGTAVGDANITKLDSARAETPQIALAKYGLFSAEPTVLSPVWSEYIDGQAGFKEYFPDGFEIIVPGGKAAAIRLTTPSTMTTCNVAVALLCEE